MIQEDLPGLPDLAGLSSHDLPGCGRGTSERNYPYFLGLYVKYIEPIADTFAYALLRDHSQAMVLIKFRSRSPSRVGTVEFSQSPAIRMSKSMSIWVTGSKTEEMARVGTVLWVTPSTEFDRYVLIGGPGQNTPPDRNCAVAMVLKVTGFPHTPAELAAFHWIDGKGSYLKLILGKQLLLMPKSVQGIWMQLAGWRIPDTKLRQDIASCLFMAADVVNRLFIIDESEQTQGDEGEEVPLTPRGKRAARGHSGRELRQNPGRARP